MSGFYGNGMPGGEDEEPLRVRSCTLEDLDELMELQERICRGIKDPDWFVDTSREENERYLKAPNKIFGIFSEWGMAAYGSIVFPGEAADNLAWDLGWDAERVKKCSRLDTIVVDSSFRGRGLQRRLIRLCCEYAAEIIPGGCVLTTVSPYNSYSLNNVKAEGFQELKRTKKYGGKERFILGIDFASIK